MRKTFPSHVLAELTSTRDGSPANARPSRRKRAVKAKAPAPTFNNVFERLAEALQPALDEVDAAWA